MNRTQVKAARIFLTLRKRAKEEAEELETMEAADAPPQQPKPQQSFLSKHGPTIGGGLLGALLSGATAYKASDPENALRNALIAAVPGAVGGGAIGKYSDKILPAIQGLGPKLKGLLGGGGEPKTASLLGIMMSKRAQGTLGGPMALNPAPTPGSQQNASDLGGSSPRVRKAMRGRSTMLLPSGGVGQPAS